MGLMRTGAMLTGQQIARAVKAGDIEISDFDSYKVNPNSYNISIGETVTMYDKLQLIDLADPSSFKDIVRYRIPQEGIILRPGSLYLIPTKEVIYSKRYIPLITGRSSVGRLGLTIHQEAGFGDLGFHGRWTLQVKVTYPTRLYAGVSIAQVYFLTPEGPTDLLYCGKYQGSNEAVSSRWT